MIALHAAFKTIGWRWPFRAGDKLEVWRGMTLVAELEAELLASIVVHHLAGHDLVRQFDAAIIPAAPDPVLRPARPLVKMPPRAVGDRDYRAELRARRRARNQPTRRTAAG